jgi:DNA-binding transcriptional ArsR family regulator
MGMKSISFDVLETIEYLDLLSDDDFIATYFKHVFDIEPSKDKELIEATIDEYIISSRIELKIDDIMDFIENVAVFKKRFIDSVRIFYNKNYSLFENEIFNKLIENSNDLKSSYLSRFGSDENFIKKIIVIEPERFLKSDADITVFLGYFNQNIIKMDLDDNIQDKIVISIGIDLIDKILNKSLVVQESIKLLSDPTKVEILKLLSKGSLYSNEIAKALSINKSTVSFHMNKLLLAGFVKPNLSLGRKIFFSTDKEAIKNVFDQFLEEL